MSRASISGAGPLQKRGVGLNAKAETEPKPRSVNEWLDSRRNGTPAPVAPRGSAVLPAKSSSAAVQGGLTVNGAAQRPNQPADSLDDFITSGKVQCQGPSIFGGAGGGAAKGRFQKIAAADVWPDGMPGRPGSRPSAHAMFFDDGDMEDALPSQPFAPQQAGRPAVAAAGSRAGSRGGARPPAAVPFDAGPFDAQSAAPSHGRRAVGAMPQQRYAGGAAAGGGFAGRRSVGGPATTRPW